MTQVSPKRMQHAAAAASRLMAAMANDNRLMILCQLIEGEKTVGQLASLIGLSQSALSQHLARLRADKLVRTRRQAQTIWYSLHGNDARRVIDLLFSMYCVPNRKSAGARATAA